MRFLSFQVILLPLLSFADPWYVAHIENFDAHQNINVNIWFTSYQDGVVLGSNAGYIRNAGAQSALNNFMNFTYHIHEYAVPTGKVDCTAVGDVFDGTWYQNKAQAKEAGDLTGKFGCLKVDACGNIIPYYATDFGIQLKAGSGVDIIGKALVVKTPDDKIVGCGTISQFSSAAPT